MGARSRFDHAAVHDAFVKAGGNSVKMAKLLGCSQHQAWDRGVQEGLIKPAPYTGNRVKWQDEELQLLKKLRLEDRKTVAEIAKTLGRTFSSVQRRLQIARITIRPRSVVPCPTCGR